MSEETSNARSLLYAKLLGETAAISWQELEPFFARGATLRVASDLNLVEVATAVSLDEKAQVAGWLSAGGLGKLEAEQAQEWIACDAGLWAVVVAPWVLVQERQRPSAEG
ncbi:DUF2288 domain-containing protein [Stutzerimonas tarimensis]|uniref:DUF2288 domain-containing protein n=1 Tax=Stutzerimonas tarimensis TaxID=1507735 RepID=A0ABV7T576_9GAMM